MLGKLYKVCRYLIFMVKCSLCKNKIEETFLGKIKGTYVGGKVICSECQRKVNVKKKAL